jgi:2-hydroxy-4-carboxymuconate semialdehyde hemiacetal dehydrogenase
LPEIRGSALERRLGEGIKRADAVILTTPTMHRRQGEQVMRAGKHVLIEIPIADSVADSKRW